MNNYWHKPDHFMLTIRCTNRKYARNFFEKGEIKFSTPQSWVKYELEKGSGRGDIFEGSIVVFNNIDLLNSINLWVKYVKIYDDIFRFQAGNQSSIKRHSTMELPCFCLYILKQSKFTPPENEGYQEISTVISSTYFKDFADHLSVEEIDRLCDDDKPAVILIKNFNLFRDRLKDKLLEIGLNEDEIIITRIGYYDFTKYGDLTWWDFGQKSPMEIGRAHV